MNYDRKVKLVDDKSKEANQLSEELISKRVSLLDLLVELVQDLGFLNFTNDLSPSDFLILPNLIDGLSAGVWILVVSHQKLVKRRS